MASPEDVTVPGIGRITAAARASPAQLMFGGDSEYNTVGSLVADAVQK